MRVRTHRGQTVLALIAATGLIAGCSGTTGSKPVAQIRTLNATTNGDFITVSVNGSATFGEQTLNGSAPAYLFVSPGSSQFSYISTTDAGQTTSNLPPGISAYTTTANLSANTNYTAYAVGRPDLVTAITTLPFPYGSMQDVVYPDTHSGPPSGSVNLRFLDAAPDANGQNGVDIELDGTKIVTDLTFGNISSFQVKPSGSHLITVVPTGSSTALFTPVTLNFHSQKSETIIFQEPTATPIPSPTSFTFGLQQVEDN